MNRGWEEDFKHDGVMSQILRRLGVLEKFVDGQVNKIQPYSLILPAHGLAATVAAGATNYLPLFYYGINATGFNLSMKRPGNLNNFSIRTGTAQPGTGSLVFNVQVGNADSVLEITVPAGGAAGEYTNTTDEVAVVSGDLVRIEVTNNAAGASATIGAASLEEEINPI